MKKLTFTFVAVAAMMMAACGNKQKAAEGSSDSTETFEERQIKAGMSVQLDSLTQCLLRLNPSKFYSVTPDGKINLSADEKKVTPDYLFIPEKLEGKLETLSAKYRALTVYYIDQKVAQQYEMNDMYSQAMQKLASEVNDPALKLIKDEEVTYNDKNFAETNKKLYKIEEENERANFFWECAATAIVEQTFLLTQNQEKLLANFTDKDAEDITYRIALLVDAFEELSEYNPQLMQLLSVLQPLEKLNAISVDQLRQQLNDSKEEVAQSRKSLFEF